MAFVGEHSTRTETPLLPFGMYYLQAAPPSSEVSRGTKYTNTTTSKDGTEEADTDWEDRHDC